MELARLCGEQQATAYEVTVATSTGLENTVVVRRGIVESDSLKAHREECLEFAARALPIGTTRILAKSPFLDDVKTSHLDARGIVKPGTIAQNNMMAVAAVCDTFVPSEDALGRPQPAPAGKEWCLDNSLRFGHAHEGYRIDDVVFESSRERPNPLPRGLQSRVKILLTRADAVEVGDVLFVNKYGLTVVKHNSPAYRRSSFAISANRMILIMSRPLNDRAWEDMASGCKHHWKTWCCSYAARTKQEGVSVTLAACA